MTGHFPRTGLHQGAMAGDGPGTGGQSDMDQAIGGNLARSAVGGRTGEDDRSGQEVCGRVGWTAVGFQKARHGAWR